MNAPLDSIAPQLRGLIGQPVQALPTRCLVVDLDALNRNVQRMAEFCARHHIRLRPHAKTHKSAMLASLQLQAGAVGVCVQKVSEAEALIAQGVNDVLISNEMVAQHKLLRVAELAQRLSMRKGQLGIAVDSLRGIEALASAMRHVSATVDVYIEINVGQNRCGVPPGEAAVTLAKAMAHHSQLKLVGLQAYNGKIQHLKSAQDRQQAVATVAQAIALTRQALQNAGINQPLRVTGGGSGAFAHETACGQYDELQAGSYVFMDAEYANNEETPTQPSFEHSLFVLTQVMSASAEHVVCDAGHKSHAIDAGLPRIHNRHHDAQLLFANGGDEHGILRSSEPDGPLPAIGDLVWLIPGHCDPTVNLHNHMVAVTGGLDNGRITHIIPVDARGCVQ